MSQEEAQESRALADLIGAAPGTASKVAGDTGRGLMGLAAGLLRARGRDERSTLKARAVEGVDAIALQRASYAYARRDLERFYREQRIRRERGRPMDPREFATRERDLVARAAPPGEVRERGQEEAMASRTPRSMAKGPAQAAAAPLAPLLALAKGGVGR